MKDVYSFVAYSEILYRKLYGDVMYTSPRWTVYTRPYGDFDQPNAIGDGWVIPQTQESHNTTSKPVRHRPYPYAIVPKTPLRVGCGCILYCMETRCIGCMLQLYIAIHPSRLVPARPSRYTAYTAYTAIQLYTLYSIQHYTASLRWSPDVKYDTTPHDGIMLGICPKLRQMSSRAISRP